MRFQPVNDDGTCFVHTVTRYAGEELCCDTRAKLRELLPSDAIGRPPSADGVRPPLPNSPLPPEITDLLDSDQPEPPQTEGGPIDPPLPDVVAPAPALSYKPLPPRPGR